MSEGISKHLNHEHDINFGDLLHQIETFEQVYPYYKNMIQPQQDPLECHERELKSMMKKEKRD